MSFPPQTKQGPALNIQAGPSLETNNITFALFCGFLNACFLVDAPPPVPFMLLVKWKPMTLLCLISSVMLDTSRRPVVERRPLFLVSSEALPPQA